MSQTRKPYFDLMRIVAIFFVIFNHTGYMGFSLHAHRTPGSPAYWAYLALSVFCTFAVPLFFMISGALVLPKADVQGVWKKKIPKQALILLLFSLFYHVWCTFVEGDATRFATLPGNSTVADLPGGESGSADAALSLPSAGMFLTVLYAGSWNFSFWFLYAYIAFLISAPLLRTLAEHMTNHQYLYLFGLDIVFKALVPILNWTVFKGEFNLNSNLLLTWAISDIVIYPLAGYFLEHRFNIQLVHRQKWLLPALWGLNLITIGIAMAMTYHKSLLTGAYNEAATQTFHRVFNLINAGTIYITIKYGFERKRPELRKVRKVPRAILTSAGTCTFGIYLLHVAVLKSEQMESLFPALTSRGVPDLFAGLVPVTLTLLMCWALTAIWKGVVALGKRVTKT